MSWGDYTRELLEARDLSIRAWSETIGYESGNITRMLQGKVKPPWKHVDTWADSLRLKGDERRKFRRLMGIAGLPEGIRDELYAVSKGYEELLAKAKTAGFK